MEIMRQGHSQNKNQQFNPFDSFFGYGDDSMRHPAFAIGIHYRFPQKIQMPSVFMKNYKVSNCAQQFNDTTTKENQDSTANFWKENNEIIDRYRKKEDKLITKGRHKIGQKDQQRIMSADPKNVFLRKMLKQGKIKDYNQEQLKKQVLKNLQELGKSKRISANRTFDKRTNDVRPKTSIVRMAYDTYASTHNRMAQRTMTTSKAFRSRQHNVDNSLQDQLNVLLPKGNENFLQNVQEQFNKNSSNFKKIDGSISCQTMKKIRSFINRVREMQNNI